jgi:hypothetical protein
MKVGDLLDSDGYLSFDTFKVKFPGIVTNFLIYEGVIRAIKRYQKLLNVDFDGDVVIEDALVWRCL